MFVSRTINGETASMTEAEWARRGMLLNNAHVMFGGTINFHTTKLFLCIAQHYELLDEHEFIPCQMHP